MAQDGEASMRQENVGRLHIPAKGQVKGFNYTKEEICMCMCVWGGYNLGTIIATKKPLKFNEFIPAKNMLPTLRWHPGDHVKVLSSNE